MNPIKRIKDLPFDCNLSTVKFRYPKDGKCYYWFSQWGKGVWGKTDLNSERMIPLFVNNLEETLEWEVVEWPKE